MKPINPHLLTSAILSRAPHRRLLAYATVCQPTSPAPAPMALIADEFYLMKLKHNTFCEYLTDSKFRAIQPFRGYKKVVNSQPLPPAGKSKKAVKQPAARKKLLNVISMLNSNKGTFSAYLEAEETLLGLTAEECRQQKRYLVYIYRWIVNQREWENLEIEKLGTDLKGVVIGKIYEGHHSAEEQNRVKQELERVELRKKEELELQKLQEDKKTEKVKSTYEGKSNSEGKRKNK